MDAMDDHAQSLKRKRTPDADVQLQHVGPPPKKASNHLAINYLARQKKEDLPLISTEDPLPTLLHLLNDYGGVLDRHESMAFNLGARPLGPILFKRFERLFDGPPKVLKNGGKDGSSITWLDVVEFARSKPEQFTLGQMSEGTQVCQFYTKQCRVQISEEDYVLISSGMPQKLIPPQPVLEDEEKELGTLEILEGNLTSVCQMADQVAARVRQIRHRIASRKRAILDRRASENSNTLRAHSPSNVALLNGNGNGSMGFVAVNSRPVEGSGSGGELSTAGASEDTKSELLRQFSTVKLLKKMGGSGDGYASSPGLPSGRSPATVVRESGEYPPSGFNIVTTPTSTTTPTQSTPKDDGPYKAEIMARMDALKRGDRIIPPCDRCRRLHMDCIKNLTACLGCTKKHAKCAWREVRPEELAALAASKDDIGIGQPLPIETDTRSSNGNGHIHDNSPTSALSRSSAMDTAVESLAAVAQASTAALESTELASVPVRTPLFDPLHPPQVQSPNLVQHHHQHPQINAHHQSPNIPPSYGFSPTHHHTHGSNSNSATSINMPYASPSSRRISSPVPTHDEPTSSGELRFDVNANSDKSDMRAEETLLV